MDIKKPAFAEPLELALTFPILLFCQHPIDELMGRHLIRTILDDGNGADFNMHRPINPCPH